MRMRRVRRISREVDIIVGNNPFQVYFLLLCLITGPGLALELMPAPDSIETLPSAVVRLWGITLAIGGFVTLIGMIMSHRLDKRRFIEGSMVEAGGLIALGSACVVLALAVVVRSGIDLFGILTYVMFGICCLSRFRALRRTVSEMREAIVLERKELDGR